ncbi:Gamma-Aminobutyric Acid Receptor Subunit Delta [Manis pentadactyla]|nr:Gamma-Aminobutyric Acid Receptor Subunit Delta [Manis pentadactyla]
MARLSFRYTFRMRIEADGVISETLALRKELGSGSDVKESKMVDQVLLDFRSISDEGECMIDFEDKAEKMGALKDEG